MENLNKTFGDLPSNISNPFTKSSIQSIRISMHKGIFGNIYFTGVVEFKNNNTKGEQNFDGKDLADVFIQVKNFCEQLKD